MWVFVEKYLARNIPIMNSSVKNINLAIVQQISASRTFLGCVGGFTVGGGVAVWSVDSLGMVDECVLMFNDTWFGDL